jgi:hypothetical protein
MNLANILVIDSRKMSYIHGSIQTINNSLPVVFSPGQFRCDIFDKEDKLPSCVFSHPDNTPLIILTKWKNSFPVVFSP